MHNNSQSPQPEVELAWLQTLTPRCHRCGRGALPYKRDVSASRHQPSVPAVCESLLLPTLRPPFCFFNFTSFSRTLEKKKTQTHPKLTNRPQGVERQPGCGPPWISLLPHTVNCLHLSWRPATWGPAGSCSPAASAFLSWPPAVEVWPESASNKDGNPCNQPPQVVHLGGPLLPSPWGCGEGGGWGSVCGVWGLYGPGGEQSLQATLVLTIKKKSNTERVKRHSRQGCYFPRIHP